MERDSSGTRVDSSTVRTTPVPPQVGQAPPAVEGQLLRPRGPDLCAADRAENGLLRRHGQGGRNIMPVGAAVAGKPGVHEPQAVKELCPGAEGGTDAGDAGPLVEDQGSGDVEHLVHLSLGGLGHAPAGVGGERLQVAPGALCVEDPQGQGGLPGAGPPAMATIWFRGTSTSMFFRLWTRAPWILIVSGMAVSSQKWMIGLSYARFWRKARKQSFNRILTLMTK